MEKVLLGDVLDVQRGASLSGEFYAELGVRIRLTLGNFDYPNGGFKKNTSKKDIYFNGPINSKFILKKGDLITPLTEQVAGLLGTTAFIPEDDLYIQSGNIGLVTTNENRLLRKYAYYLLNSSVIKKQLGAAAQQTKIRHTSPDAIKSCIAWIPNIDQQLRITNILGTIDKKIEICKKMIKILDQHLTELFDYKYLAYKDYKLVWNDKMNKFVPEGWQVFQLGELFSFVKGKIPTILQEIQDKICDSVYLTIDAVNGGKEMYCSSKNMPHSKGNVLMVMDGAASGDVYVGYDGVVGSTFCMLETKQQFVSNSFLYQILTRYSANYKKTNVGSTVPHANKDYIQTMLIALPTKIDSQFDFFRYKIIKLTKQIKKLQELRNYLLPLLMNGQVTVQ